MCTGKGSRGGGQILEFYPPSPFNLTSYTLSQCKSMPKVKRSRKSPPEGWELIEPTLDELDQKMREGKLYLAGIFDLLNDVPLGD